MRKYQFILALVAIFFPVLLFGQSAKEDIFANPEKVAGTYLLYDFDTPALSKAPKGYKAFHIAHFGRHGARYFSRESYLELVEDVLNKAEAKGVLSPEGVSLKQRIDYLAPMVRLKSGDLSYIGWEQHKRIAKEMYKQYHEVFKNKPQITTYSTHVPRCILSMSAFCQGLKEEDKNLEIMQMCSNSLLKELNPFAQPGGKVAAEPGTETLLDPWGGTSEEFAKSCYDVDAICSRFFSDPSFLKEFDTGRFISRLCLLTRDMPCIGNPVQMDDVLTLEENYGFWRLENYRMFLKYGPMSTASLPLLENFIGHMEEDMKAESSVRLRFSHDTSMAPLLCLLEVNDWATMPKDASHIEDTFRIYNIPMASTFYVVCYKNKKGDVLVKGVHNGKEVSFSALTPVYGNYYKWTDFQEFCHKKVETFKSMRSR